MWGKTPYSSEELSSLKIGDVVTIDTADGGQVTAPIVWIERQWGTEMLPRITLEGHDKNWTTAGPGGSMDFSKSRMCGAHMVVKIVSRVSYCPGARGDYVREYDTFPWEREKFGHPRYACPRGVICARYGELESVFRWALCKSSRPIRRMLDVSRATAVWERAGKPGFIRTEMRFEHAPADVYITEKHFLRFVQKNVSKLLYTTKEMHAFADESFDEIAEDMREAICEANQGLAVVQARGDLSYDDAVAVQSMREMADQMSSWY